MLIYSYILDDARTFGSEQYIHHIHNDGHDYIQQRTFIFTPYIPSIVDYNILGTFSCCPINQYVYLCTFVVSNERKRSL